MLRSCALAAKDLLASIPHARAEQLGPEQIGRDKQASPRSTALDLDQAPGGQLVTGCGVRRRFESILPKGRDSLSHAAAAAGSHSDNVSIVCDRGVLHRHGFAARS